MATKPVAKATATTTARAPVAVVAAEPTTSVFENLIAAIQVGTPDFVLQHARESDQTFFKRMATAMSPGNPDADPPVPDAMSAEVWDSLGDGGAEQNWYVSAQEAFDAVPNKRAPAPEGFVSAFVASLRKPIDPTKIKIRKVKPPKAPKEPSRIQHMLVVMLQNPGITTDTLHAKALDLGYDDIKKTSLAAVRFNANSVMGAARELGLLNVSAWNPEAAEQEAA